MVDTQQRQDFMRGCAGMVGMLKSGGLLGDGMIDNVNSESQGRARRVMTPQREYPIFNPGYREPGVQLGSNSDHSRANFQDGQGIWKVIHTDTHSNSSGGHNILTRSASAVSLERTSGCQSKPRPEPPAGGGRIALKTVPHSPQHVNNILSPQLQPLERSSPKRTQLHITSSQVTQNGKLTPMVTNHPTLSPEQQLQARPTTYDRDPNVESHPNRDPSTGLPPASRAASAARSPHQVTLRSPGTVFWSPRRTWKSSLQWVVSPASTFRGNDQQAQISKTSTRDLNYSSFQGSSDRATACVNSLAAAAAVPSWRGCGDGGGDAVVAALDREMICQEFSGELERPDRVGSKKVVTSRSGASKLLNFLSRSRKKPGNHGGSCATTTAESTLLESDDVGSVFKPDSESIKVLDYTIKTLRYKLEQANQKRTTAVEEVRALQSALEASDEKCRQLSQRCQELELLKLSVRSNMEFEVGTMPPEVLNPEVFPEVFEDAITTLRKLASAICHHIRENGESATQVIATLLEQHKVTRGVTRMPRNVIILYFESFLNQVMFESFENVTFEPNGAAAVVCPQRLRHHAYQSFQSLKPLEWGAIEKEWRRKPDAVVVDANFHRFFVVRMELVVAQLGRVAENCEIEGNLMASFFDAVKAVWLVHHLAFAFREPVSIFRVAPASEFDARFMEQVAAYEGEPPAGVRSKISVMLNPGFIFNRQIIKCQVYCSGSSYE